MRVLTDILLCEVLHIAAGVDLFFTFSPHALINNNFRFVIPGIRYLQEFRKLSLFSH